MNITEFRSQYPQYKDMDDTTLANSLYKKHYADMPREEFDSKFIGKQKEYKVGTDFKHHMLREEVIKNQSADLKKKPTFASKAVDELTGISEFVNNTGGMIAALPMDAGHLLGGLADSVVQEDLSRENIHKNIDKRAATTRGLREIVAPSPKSERGQSMVNQLSSGFSYPGEIVNTLIYNTLLGPDRNRHITKPVIEDFAEQVAGVVSVAADMIPFVLAERGVTAMRRSAYNVEPNVIKPSKAQAIPRINLVDQHERVMSDLQKQQDAQNLQRSQTKIPQESQPNLLHTKDVPKGEITPEEWNHQFNQERIDRQAAVREAIAKDEVALAREMSYGRENPLVTNILSETSRKLQNLEEQQPGIFNHDVTDGIPSVNNLEVAPEVKPVIKATPAEFADMRVQGLVNANTHFSFFPNGPGSDVVYIINKNGLKATGKTLEQVKADLAAGNESQYLGYPERSPIPEENKTAAVTKDNRILTNAEEIKSAQAQGELKWAAEGRPEEVLTKAEEVSKSSKLDIDYSKREPTGTFLEGKEKIGEGSEAVIYKSGDKVIKVQEPYSDPSPETYKARVDNALLIDELVGDGTLKELGYYESKNGTRNPILEQDYIEGRDATQAEIDAHMQSRGFTKTDKGYSKVINDKEYHIKDLDGDNVKVDSQGRTHVIDAVVQTKSIEKIKNNGSGESSASLEAQSRLAGQKARGESYWRVTKGKKVERLADTVDGVDIFNTKPDEVIIKVKDGRMEKVHGEGEMPREVPFDKPVVEEKVGEYDLSSEFQDKEGIGIGEEKKTLPASNESVREGIPELDVPPNTREVVDIDAPRDTTAEEILVDGQELGSGVVDMNLGVHPNKIANDLIDGVSTSVRERTSYAVRNAMRSILNPQFLAEHYPVIAKIYNAMGLRREYGNSLKYDLFKEGIEQGLKLQDKVMTPEQKADLATLIDKSDIYKIFHSDKSLKEGNNLLHKVVDDVVIEGYKIFRKQVEANIRREALERRELAVLQFKDRPWYNDLREIFVDKTLDLEENPYYLEDKGLAFNQQFVRDFKKVGKRIAEVDSVEAQRLESPFYAPRVREGGDWAVHAFEVVDGEIRKDLPIFFKMAKTPKKIKKLKADVEANPTKYFPINYERMQKGGSADYAVVIEETKRLPEDIYLFSGRPEAAASKVRFSLDRLKDKGKIPEEVYDDIWQEVMDSYEEVTLMRGYGRHSIKRNERLIEGYDNSNYFHTIRDYTSGMAGALSKAKASMEYLKLMQEAPTEFQGFVQEMITNNLRNRNTTMDAWSSTVRSALTLWHLGFRGVSILANSTQNLSFGAAEMNMRLRRDFNLKSTADVDIPRAQKDIVLKSNITTGERQAIDWFDRLGADQAQFVNELSGAGAKGVSNKLQSATTKAMHAFGVIESKWNRESLFLAMYRRLKSNGVKEEVARQTAKEVSNTAHGDMSPENLPLAFQGPKMEPIARGGLALRRYGMHSMNYLLSRMAQKQYRPVLRVMTMQAAMGGLKAIPLLYAANEVLEKYFGRSVLLELKAVIHNMMDSSNETLAEVIDRVVERGLPSVVGVDISNNLTMDMPFMFEQGDKTFFDKVFGVAATDLKNIGKGVKRAMEGQPGKGIIMNMPSVIKDPASAVLGMTGGFVDKSGAPLVDSDGKPVKLDLYEGALRAVGITPARVGNIRDMRSSEYNLVTYYNERMQSYTTRIKNAQAEKNHSKASRLQKERLEFNKEFRHKFPGLVKPAKYYKGNRRNTNLENSLRYERNNF